ncbi:MAG TPA: glutamate formimidoyltransferase [Chitinophagales bacterium]|nr:glutamate formimidoyltransferase [Chitinophagales bacterium]
MFSKTDQLIECVPNFSEGRNQVIIDAIANTIRKIDGVKLMNIDIGFDANRTVYTFAGKPQAVLEAAFQAIKKANELIDMRTHKGEHPRMGACDVCPLIPIQNISMNEVVGLSAQLGKRVGELGIPVFLYEYSAANLTRKSLAYLRKGEYEAIEEKMKLPAWKPDFGELKSNSNFGMMALGARDFLIAYNINLTTKDETIAKQIAKQIRILREKKDGSYESNLVQHVKAIGWFMQAFDCAQVSMNITNIEKSPIIEVFSLVKKMAQQLGENTNGSELIGLIPLKAFNTNNDFFDEYDLDKKIEYLGLNAVKPFSKEENIIEYKLGI